MTRIGLVGIGFMGMTHFRAYQKLRGAKVAAVATRDPKKLAGDWRGIKGNFGPPGEVVDLARVERHADWRELVRNPNIDLVDICLPPNLHAEVAVAALAAGKHVLVEKPISTDLADARRMTQAAEKHGRLLMIGHVLPFFPEYAWALAAVRSGRHGKLLGGHFKRIISDPTWLKDFYDPKLVGGPVVDLHIPDAHFIRLDCGMTKAVHCTGRRLAEVVEFVNAQFMFDDPDLVVTAASGVLPQQGRGFTHGFEMYFERATLLYEFAMLDGQPTTSTPLTIVPQKGKTRRVKMPLVDPFAAELGEAARAVKHGQPSTILDGSLALDALSLCLKESESVVKQRLVKV